MERQLFKFDYKNRVLFNKWEKYPCYFLGESDQNKEYLKGEDFDVKYDVQKPPVPPIWRTFLIDKPETITSKEFKSVGNGMSVLDGKTNIVWKFVNDVCIGKRSVWTKDNRACWLEDTIVENVKTWWCGKNADYTESFIKNKS